jgi:predicted metalloendopeptidase
VRKEKMLYSLETSVHSPAEDRVDRIVPQFQEWVDAFDIDEGDPLFIPVKDRLKFF